MLNRLMMALNGTNLINNPFNETLKPFTDFFDNILGNGMIFFLIPLIGLTYGIYIKTESATMTTVFMIGSGALLSGGSMFVGAGDVGFAFIIFMSIGIVGLFSSLLLGRN